MPLREKPPEAITKRLKAFMFSEAGVGKTTAAIQFPRPYIIDAEKGSENYDKLINGAGGVVFQSCDADEVVQEVKNLLTEKHDYRTLVIDPITPIYNDLLDKCEQQVGADFGRHYGMANKTMKRLMNFIMSLDMNVIITAHAKTEYGPNLSKLGYTFDGWKNLPYIFDLVLELSKVGEGAMSTRNARVRKTRIEKFKDGEVFEWSYKAIKDRYDVSVLERQAQQVSLATPEQVREVKDLLNIVRLPDDTVEKWWKKANVDSWEDMPADAIAKCIEHVRKKLPGTIAAA